MSMDTQHRGSVEIRVTVSWRGQDRDWSGRPPGIGCAGTPFGCFKSRVMQLKYFFVTTTLHQPTTAQMKSTGMTTRVPCPRLFLASPQKRKKYILKISKKNLMSLVIIYYSLKPVKISYANGRVSVRIFYKNNLISFLAPHLLGTKLCVCVYVCVYVCV